ncbi:uncharacterized protein TOT_030000558 [Theileria orientalis strain Shintoku]|uniref:Uncharacterized protein n=1 Tax=Theileria orientalis strain Shintoku TaxID=869250 RepID=J4D9B4_THEOR|nr:uncharacterized protein TOT_030000558 [Theileria orientalis strain Shintoku]BAM41295.1 uncharacterized protein TOT_030000558 [Theileria orientalis strain Shintoku]|eukprot:XP_009691596.1 uncharacterized protein TOT_030000558 [Theileria orientalis strain Shintoku]
MYVSLVGRSNVGKSRLFNSILSHAGRRSTVLRSIVSEKPGTTRDSKQSHMYIRGNRVTLVDTGGFEGFHWSGAVSTHHGSIPNINVEKTFTHIENEARRAIQSSNLVFFVVDGKEGVTPLDIQLGEKLRAWIEGLERKPEVKLVINKLENDGSEEYYEELSECLADCYSLEFGEPVVVSAHTNEGIEELTGIIKSRLAPRDMRKLEDMAILGNNSEGDQEAADEELEDIEELHRHCEIEKTLRTCSSVRGTYRPNERWMKLLNSVCGIPFVEREEGQFVIPSMMSPSERLARLYISDKRKATNHDSGGAVNSGPLSSCEPQQGTDEVRAEEPCAENADDKMGSNRGVGSSFRSGPKSKTRIHEENVVNPISVLVLGSVDSDRDRLLSLLCENYEQNKVSDLSPNWHSFYSSWQLRLGGKTVEQPVEIVVTAALNLGGSLGKMAVVQTLSLLRRCDFVIFCINNTHELRRSDYGTRKVAMSKREVAWLSRAVRFKKPTTLAVHVDDSSRDCQLFLTKEYPLSFEFTSIPIVPIPSGSKSAQKLKNTIGSLLHRGKRMVDTSTLNAWLSAFVARWPPPWKDGSKVNLKFAAQVRASPPTFVLWSNVYATFPQHYLRQLKLALSEEFGFLGVPLKFVLKTTFTPSRSKRITPLKLKRQIHN